MYGNMDMLKALNRVCRVLACSPCSLVRDTNPDERRPAPNRSSARKPSTVRRVLVAKQKCSGCEAFKFCISSRNITVSAKRQASVVCCPLRNTMVQSSSS